jgi:NADH-quinone oxidoreductase subunit J
MTTKPSFNTGGNFVQGLAAVALFAVMAVVFLTASFPAPEGFPEGANVVGSIGYAMFNLDGGDIAGEGMLVAFEIIDFVLVGALAGAVLLARRESGDRTITGLMTDGGRSRESGSDAAEPTDDGGDA